MPKRSKRRKRKLVFERVQWPDIVKALLGTSWLGRLTKGLRRRGQSHLDFDRRIVRRMVANSLTTIEDRTELGQRRTPKRDTFMVVVMGVRRRLEWEQWP